MDTLRPADWNEFVGQKALKRRLYIHIKAAVQEHRALEHILLTGPPGFGKTTLAKLIADTMVNDLTSYTMPLGTRMLERIVTMVEGVVLLDEIHRAPARQQEELLPLLEFGYVQTRFGRALYNENLTIVGATTEPDKIIPPLYDRFPIRPDFEPYSDDELAQIVKNMADKAGVTLPRGAAKVLGKASGGTPRNARQLVLASRDLAAHLGKLPSAQDVLDLCGVDPDGLTTNHRQYLILLNQLGGQAGLKALASVLRLNEAVVRDLERLLFDKGLITFSDRGRELTNAGYNKAVGGNGP